MSETRILVNISVDFSEFVEAMRGMRDAAKNAGISLGRLRTTTLTKLRMEEGQNRRDAIEHPDEWLSGMCGGWLHERCPSDRLSLECHCDCHA